MTDYGIKISKPGVDVKTADPHELVFSSAFKTPKIHDRGSGTLTHSSRTVTIPHNLGYPPFFLIHTQLDQSVALSGLVGDNTDYFISPFRIGTAVDLWESEDTHDIIAWVDSTNLYVKAKDNVGVDRYPVSPPSANDNENMAFESALGAVTGKWYVGNDSGASDVHHGAVRIRSVGLDKDETIVSATLNLYIGYKNGSGEIKSDIFGIDEDDTGAFNSGTFPTARTKTTAKTDHNFSVSQGEYAGADVKAQVEEIVSRSGWSNGNDMGFIIWDDGTADGTYVGEQGAGSNSDVSIVRSSTLANFKYTIFLNQLA